jgi:hypothetical protein
MRSRVAQPPAPRIRWGLIRSAPNTPFSSLNSTLFHPPNQDPEMFGLRRTRTAPSPYPKLAFHGIRCAQLLASLVVMAVMWFFLWNLINEHFDTPKTFWTVGTPRLSVSDPDMIQLLAAATATMLTLAGTLLIYLLFGLAPFVSLCINGLLLALWAPSFGFLWYWTRKTLSQVCSPKTWRDDTGVMVCRIYKVLFAFCALGL